MVTKQQKLRMKKIYAYNEGRNYHRENANMLIKAFGTKAQKKKAIELNRKIERRGEGMTMEESRWFYENGHKYYYKLLDNK